MTKIEEKNNKNSGSKIWGPAITMKQINVHIPRKQSYKWEKLKNLFKTRNQEIQVSPDGGLFMIDTSLRIAEIFFPLARSLGYDPISFTEERLDVVFKIFENCIDKNKVESIIQSRDDLLDVFDKHVKIGLNHVVNEH